MIILVNWVTNFRPPKFQKSSILTPYFQILGNTLVWMDKEVGEQLKEIVGWVGKPSEILARTVGDGLKKMMKKSEGER